MRKKIVLTIAVVVVVLSISGLSQFLPSEDNSMETDTVTLDNQINIEKQGDTFNFTFNTVEKETITINELLMEEKPLLIYFFATWCPVCDKDLQNLNTVYSSDIDRVSVLVVGFDPSENIDMIRQYKESKEYSWIFAEYNKEALLHFKVITQSTKIGINTKGNIVFNEGYGVTDNDGWRRMLERLE